MIYKNLGYIIITNYNNFCTAISQTFYFTIPTGTKEFKATKSALKRKPPGRLWGAQTSDNNLTYSHTSFYELPLYETSELRNRFLEVTASTKNQQIL